MSALRAGADQIGHQGPGHEIKRFGPYRPDGLRGRRDGDVPVDLRLQRILLSLDDLSVDSIPRGGTNISQAIQEAVKAYQGRPIRIKPLF